MKKILLALLFVVGLSYSSKGQMDTVSGPDGRVSEWYFSYWYDTCVYYWEDTDNPRIGPTIYLAQRHFAYLAKGEYVPRPSALKGVAVWIAQYPPNPGYAFSDSISKLPEYIYVVQKGVDTMIWLESVRWDTATPRVLKIPCNYDSARHGFNYCLLYTAYFNKPVEVDSVYYLLGSHFSNIVEGNMAMHRWTVYTGMLNYRPLEPTCTIPLRRYVYFDSNAWYANNRNYWSDLSGSGGTTRSWGYFMPIIEFVDLRVESADSTMGTAGPSGDASPNTWQTIWARAKRGYRFSHWNDGDTNNPRQIRLMHDTLFTAYFGNAEQHTVSVSSNTTLGHVEGGGIYYYGDTATLKAVPEVINYTFVRWNDSVTDNPRKVVIRSDTAFTAYFKRKGVEGIEEAEAVGFTLVPNPAREKVTIVLDGMKQRARLSMHDMKGREVWGSVVTGERDERELDLAPYAPGVYFVTLTTERSTEVRRLVVGE